MTYKRQELQNLYLQQAYATTKQIYNKHEPQQNIATTNLIDNNSTTNLNYNNLVLKQRWRTTPTIYNKYDLQQTWATITTNI